MPNAAAQRDRLRGSLVPLVTPFRAGRLDERALAKLIDWQLDAGSHGLGTTGTTGEPAALTADERLRVFEITREAAAGRVPIIAGTGSSNHPETLALTKQAEQAGADAALVVVPYYTRPSQAGIFNHFKQVADSVPDLPIILYDIPGRTAVALEIDTVARLREACPNIVGIKEANPDFAFINRLLGKLGRDFLVYSGIELLCFPLLAIGGAGHFSATGNVMPREVAQLYELVKQGKWDEARDLHYRLMPLNDALFLETNPVPAKTALGMMGRIDPEVRPPLAPLSPANEAKLRQTLADYGLLEHGRVAP